MLSKIKTYAIAALAVIAGVLAALWQYQRAAFANARLKGEKRVRKTEKKAVNAMIAGLENENEVKNDKADPNRDDFN